jgi:hypothetical protein
MFPSASAKGISRTSIAISLKGGCRIHRVEAHGDGKDADFWQTGHAAM